MAYTLYHGLKEILLPISCFFCNIWSMIGNNWAHFPWSHFSFSLLDQRSKYRSLPQDYLSWPLSLLYWLLYGKPAFPQRTAHHPVLWDLDNLAGDHELTRCNYNSTSQPCSDARNTPGDLSWVRACPTLPGLACSGMLLFISKQLSRLLPEEAHFSGR